MRKFRILRLSIIGFVFMIPVAISCNKGNTTAVKPVAQGIKATIIFTGEFAADGCGYLVQTDSATVYHADNLPAGFQKDKLSVAVSFIASNSIFQCGLNPDTRLPVIHIKAIKNR